jgi:hypothetical protein
MPQREPLGHPVVKLISDLVVLLLAIVALRVSALYDLLQLPRNTNPNLRHLLNYFFLGLVLTASASFIERMTGLSAIDQSISSLVSRFRRKEPPEKEVARY